jgi:hypothetical protein
MKTISASEFFANPEVRHQWETGEVILVMSGGEPDIEVRKVAISKKRGNSASGCMKDSPVSGGVDVPLGEDGWQ